jgi:Serine dehydrogenase proteinase.
MNNNVDTVGAILSWLFWIFIIYSILSPMLHQKNLELQRLDLIRKFEQKESRG